MESWVWGVILAPIGALIIFDGIAFAVKLAIATLIPDCWIKRQILKERMSSNCSKNNKTVLDQAERHHKGWRDLFVTG